MTVHKKFKIYSNFIDRYYALCYSITNSIPIWGTSKYNMDEYRFLHHIIVQRVDHKAIGEVSGCNVTKDFQWLSLLLS